jgi:hypothetical protein
MHIHITVKFFLTFFFEEEEEDVLAFGLGLTLTDWETYICIYTYKFIFIYICIYKHIYIYIQICI